MSHDGVLFSQFRSARPAHSGCHVKTGSQDQDGPFFTVFCVRAAAQFWEILKLGIAGGKVLPADVKALYITMGRRKKWGTAERVALVAAASV